MIGWRVGGGGWNRRQYRQALCHQNSQVEHAQTDRYCEEPPVQLAGDPVKADQILFHPEPRTLDCLVG